MWHLHLMHYKAVYYLTQKLVDVTDREHLFYHWYRPKIQLHFVIQSSYTVSPAMFVTEA